ncbi:MAG: hypothetical protein WBW92_02390 [Rhodanobacteraceae bacterium]
MSRKLVIQFQRRPCHNRTFGEEVLEQHLFARLGDVSEPVYWRMIEYKEQRPNDSLDDLMPAESEAAKCSTLEMSA